MENITNDKPTPAELVDNDALSVANIMRAIKSPTKKRIRRIAEPHLRIHRVKDREYYYFCHGNAPEIYLGDARTILEAVKAYKIATARGNGRS